MKDHETGISVHVSGNIEMQCPLKYGRRPYARMPRGWKPIHLTTELIRQDVPSFL
jgi:hypothetical protein